MDDNPKFEKFLASDDVLFHYTRTSIVLEHILQNGKFRLSLLRDTNDPREYKFKLLNTQGWSLPDGIKELSMEAHPVFDRILRTQCRVMCFCTNAMPEIELDAGKIEIDKYASTIGWNKSRMWSQYGENHHGVCLAFSKTAILEQLKTLNDTFAWYVSGYVRYMQDDRIPILAVTLNGNQLAQKGVERYCAHHIHVHHQALFLTKHIDYRDEAEYRFVVADPNNNHEFLDISTTLKGIITGDRTPEVYFPLIDEFSQKYEATCRRAYWDRGKAYLVDMKKKKRGHP